MAGTFGATDPTPLIVRQWVAGGTGGATGVRRHPVVSVSIPFPQSTAGAGSGSGNAQFVSWVNPEVGTVLVTDLIMYFTTAGTGTYDIGVSADGTGSNDNIINGATMDSSTALGKRAYGGAAFWTTGAPTLGLQTTYVIGPGGTGTNNSIVGVVNEPTSTARGRMIISYVPLT